MPRDSLDPRQQPTESGPQAGAGHRTYRRISNFELVREAFTWAQLPA